MNRDQGGYELSHIWDPLLRPAPAPPGRRRRQQHSWPSLRGRGDAGGDKPLLHLLASLHTQQQQVCATINQPNQIQASKHHSLMRTLEEQSKDLEVSCTALLCIKNISIVIYYQPEDETFPIEPRSRGTREIMKNEQGQGIWVSSRDNYFLIYFWQ